METTQQNKLIAEFMKFKKAIVRSEKGKPYDYDLPSGFELIKEVETTIEGQWCEILEEQDHCVIGDLKFHSSWDWLMPVVKKIFGMNEYYEYVAMTSGQFENKVELTTNINQVFESCFLFIQWYNENKRPLKAQGEATRSGLGYHLTWVCPIWDIEMEADGEFAVKDGELYHEVKDENDDLMYAVHAKF
jgi:hypothetical protein